MMSKQAACSIFLLVLLITHRSFAQEQSYNHVKVDSLSAAQTRATLNQIPTENFQKRTYKQQEQALPYRLLLPKNYDKTQKYPLIITFHNSARIGNDNEKQLEPLARIWLRDEIYNNYPCFVVAPHFNERSSNYSENKAGFLESKPTEQVNLVLGLLRQLEQEFPEIDKDRIYLVGYSMGASTAQNLLSLAPKKFAAMVSIAAVPDFSNLKAMKRKNILLIHGQKDDENPYRGSAELFSKLKGNPKATFITFTELDHNTINMPLLLTDQLPRWLFNQRR
ncbi:alpha/beta fold hydrolase [Pedobacter sp. KR3-3]|uniref:Alpha/beta fold hydrolase n=1 Tax=Pedobacter albus TaxID=3113905 RepID=A0ABU7I852_9SPHI|nr:alpha/beta fold hydrolase [Pedobacter sp. KR3-3]MEE1945648.1 alpha/beta fold hydrolase [Pedobacter sp. KR3-3]